MMQFRLQMISFILLTLHSPLCNGIRLTKKNLSTLNLSSLSGLINSNLTSISYVSKVVDTNSSTTDDSFLIDLSPTQNTKSKLYTVKKQANGTMNGLPTFKYKRNNTAERSADTSRQPISDHFESIGCDLCTTSGDLNCINGNQSAQAGDNQSCKMYFKCSNQTVNSTSDLKSTNQLYNQFTSQQSIVDPLLIEKQYYCDGLCDCSRCEDEINCSLSKCDKPNEIMCQDRSYCIEPRQICDSFFNCRDHSDEIGCCKLTFSSFFIN